MKARLAKLVQDCQIDIALGSMPVGREGGKWANRAFYFRADSSPAVFYDKLHMFDVELSSGETWRESSAYEPGQAIVTIADTPLGKLGLTICYDLRFPALFQALGGCDAIAVPAAFTVPTGKAHWHIMLRARAIEASAFVIAAAQVGNHADGRATYGHSLVIDPWGDVLLDMGGADNAGEPGGVPGGVPGLGFCDIDLNRIAEVRGQIPSLANRREIPK
jgi:predicted amidohydrolase